MRQEASECTCKGTGHVPVRDMLGQIYGQDAKPSVYLAYRLNLLQLWLILRCWFWLADADLNLGAANMVLLAVTAGEVKRESYEEPTRYDRFRRPETAG